jgi:predicted RNA binding protein YcfA (HicA-like mRNA interferase family)
MPKLRTLSGQDVLRIFAKFGFEKVDQDGSHVKIRRQLLVGGRQSLTIPFHDEIDKGTLKAIFRQALRYIPESDLHPHFYTQDSSR